MSDGLLIEVRDIINIYCMGDEAVENLAMGVNLLAMIAHYSALSRETAARAVQ